MAKSHDGNFWAITSYFNPADYQRRLQNYRTFRQRLTVPLVTVELSFNGRFQLEHGDAEILVQIPSADIMWQKERLLNLALKSLPESCDKLAWLDCDIVFEDDGWAELASRKLEDVALLHLFDERHDLTSDLRADEQDTWKTSTPSKSALHEMPLRTNSIESLLAAPLHQKRLYTTGLAWASRRDVLDDHGFYDSCILGSGDRSILCAALGMFEYLVQALEMNASREEHYLAWARPYFAALAGHVSCIPGRVFHLWHGDLQDRQFMSRQQILTKFDFNPFTDIAFDRNGCWRWSTNKPGLHKAVAQYFQSRNEDGHPVRKAQPLYVESLP